jgi:hypothetical protein
LQPARTFRKSKHVTEDHNSLTQRTSGSWGCQEEELTQNIVSGQLRCKRLRGNTFIMPLFSQCPQTPGQIAALDAVSRHTCRQKFCPAIEAENLDRICQLQQLMRMPVPGAASRQGCCQHNAGYRQLQGSGGHALRVILALYTPCKEFFQGQFI